MIGNVCQCCGHEAAELQPVRIHVRSAVLMACKVCRDKYVNVPIGEWFANVVADEFDIAQLTKLGIDPTPYIADVSN